MKLIGAGFGRTGTKSLQAALQILGLNPCYHMTEVMSRPEHLDLWYDAARGKPVDWKRLFEGYQATVDWPGCTFYKELMNVYPEAKVLLSTRDPEKWYESCCQTIYGISHSFPMSLLKYVIPSMRRFTRMPDALIWKGTFKGRFEDKAFALDVFRRHLEEVKQYVPADRLLVYEVKEGWEPLCRFLGVPVPKDTPFPRLNDTAEFQNNVRARAAALMPWRKKQPS